MNIEFSPTPALRRSPLGDNLMRFDEIGKNSVRIQSGKLNQSVTELNQSVTELNQSVTELNL